MHRQYWILGSMWEDHDPDNKYVRHAVIEDDPDDVYSEALERCRKLKGRPWKVESSRKHRLEDFPFGCWPIMSLRAVSQLRDLLEDDGEFRRIVLAKNGKEIAASDYYIFNCLRKCRAVDRRAVGPEWLDGRGKLKPLAPFRLMYEHVPLRANAFRCQEEPSQLLVSKTVHDRLVTSDLSGWTLRDPNIMQSGKALIVSDVTRRQRR